MNHVFDPLDPNMLVPVWGLTCSPSRVGKCLTFLFEQTLSYNRTGPRTDFVQSILSCQCTLCLHCIDPSQKSEFHRTNLFIDFIRLPVSQDPTFSVFFITQNKIVSGNYKTQLICCKQNNHTKTKTITAGKSDPTDENKHTRVLCGCRGRWTSFPGSDVNMLAESTWNCCEVCLS